MSIPKVLIVNDNQHTLFAYRNLLLDAAGSNDYELMTATSGPEALRQVLKHEFAVILLDVNMPGMDGFEVAEVIHSNPRLSTLPIIFVTAHVADEMHRLRGYQKGAADYIFTPVIPQILQAKVAVFVSLAKEKMELQWQKEELAMLNQELQIQRVQDLEKLNAELKAENAVRKQAEQRAHELSIRDALTGLLNRRYLVEHLEHAIAYCARHQHHFALLFIDLDKFKPINDTYGHDVGDEILIRVAERLRAATREADIVARIGGDEFVILLKKIATSARASQVVEKIKEAIKQPCDTSVGCLQISASIGMAMYPQDGTTAQALMKGGDAEMYRFKQDTTQSDLRLLRAS